MTRRRGRSGGGGAGEATLSTQSGEKEGAREEEDRGGASPDGCRGGPGTGPACSGEGDWQLATGVGDDAGTPPPSRGPAATEPASLGSPTPQAEAGPPTFPSSQTSAASQATGGASAPSGSPDGPSRVAVPAPIVRLDPSVVNRIAAGEVIQRPSNALKEMLENSLDAGSTSVQVTVRDGGLKLLQIQDDGCGVDAADLPLLCERHATSKLRTYDELLRGVDTLGFRGEALASISFVSHVTVVTRTRDGELGLKATYHDGRMDGYPGADPLPSSSSPSSQPERAPPAGSGPDRPLSTPEPRTGRGGGEASPEIPPGATPVAAPFGTTISVDDLFYSAPLRRKSIRSATAEHQAILDVVSRYAIYRPGVGFLVRRAGEARPDLVTKAGATRRENVRAAYGRAAARSLLAFEVDERGEVAGGPGADGAVHGSATPAPGATPGPALAGDPAPPVPPEARGTWPSRGFACCVSGLVSDPSYEHPKGRFVLFINGRPVESPTLKREVDRRYATVLPKTSHPFVFLDVRLPPGHVDVNVHPTKKSVGFLHGAELAQVIGDAVERALTRGNESRRYLSQSTLAVPGAPTFSDGPSPAPEGGGRAGAGAPGRFAPGASRPPTRDADAEGSSEGESEGEAEASESGDGDGESERIEQTPGGDAARPASLARIGGVSATPGSAARAAAAASPATASKPAYRPEKLVRVDARARKITSFLAGPEGSDWMRAAAPAPPDGGDTEVRGGGGRGEGMAAAGPGVAGAGKAGEAGQVGEVGEAGEAGEAGSTPGREMPVGVKGGHPASLGPASPGRPHSPPPPPVDEMLAGLDEPEQRHPAPPLLPSSPPRHSLLTRPLDVTMLENLPPRRRNPAASPLGIKAALRVLCRGSASNSPVSRDSGGGRSGGDGAGSGDEGGSARSPGDDAGRDGRPPRRSLGDELDREAAARGERIHALSSVVGGPAAAAAAGGRGARGSHGAPRLDLVAAALGGNAPSLDERGGEAEGREGDGPLDPARPTAGASSAARRPEARWRRPDAPVARAPRSARPTLDSAARLLEAAEARAHAGLRDALQQASMVGWVRGRLAVQSGTRLLLLRATPLIEDAAYQRILEHVAGLARLPQVQFSPAPRIAELAAIAIEMQERDETAARAGVAGESRGTADGAGGDAEDPTPLPAPSTSAASLGALLARLLASKAGLLSDHFALDVDVGDDPSEATLRAIPAPLPGLPADPSRLPRFLLDLGARVAWDDEEPCFDVVARILAEFWSKGEWMDAGGAEDDGGAGEGRRDRPGTEAPLSRDLATPSPPREVPEVTERQRWLAEHVVLPAFRAKFHPPRDRVRDGTVTEVTRLERLYRVFERC